MGDGFDNAARIHAVFAEDASQAYGQGKAKSGDEFCAWLASDVIAAQGRGRCQSKLSVTEDEVVVTGQYQNCNNYGSPANFLMRVENGKIMHWHTRY